MSTTDSDTEDAITKEEIDGMAPAPPAGDSTGVAKRATQLNACKPLDSLGSMSILIPASCRAYETEAQNTGTADPELSRKFKVGFDRFVQESGRPGRIYKRPSILSSKTCNPLR